MSMEFMDDPDIDPSLLHPCCQKELEAAKVREHVEGILREHDPVRRRVEMAHASTSQSLTRPKHHHHHAHKHHTCDHDHHHNDDANHHHGKSKSGGMEEEEDGDDVDSLLTASSEENENEDERNGDDSALSRARKQRMLEMKKQWAEKERLKEYGLGFVQHFNTWEESLVFFTRLRVSQSRDPLILLVNTASSMASSLGGSNAEEQSKLSNERSQGVLSSALGLGLKAKFQQMAQNFSGSRFVHLSVSPLVGAGSILSSNSLGTEQTSLASQIILNFGDSFLQLIEKEGEFCAIMSFNSHLGIIDTKQSWQLSSNATGETVEYIINRIEPLLQHTSDGKWVTTDGETEDINWSRAKDGDTRLPPCGIAGCPKFFEHTHVGGASGNVPQEFQCS